MTAPTYVNAGARQTVGFASSISPALPGSRVSGNLLIAMVATNNADSRPFTFPAGWTTIDSNGSTNHPGVAFAGRIVDGSESSPIAISWGTGNDSAVAKVWQFSGNLGTIGTAIGNKNKSGDTVNSTYTNSALAIASANSLVVNLWYGNNGTVSATPTNYSLGTNETNIAMFYETVASGSSDAISQALSGSMRWQSYEFEIESQPPEADITVSMGLGISEAAAVDNSILAISASAALGVSEGTPILSVVYPVTVAMSLGISEAAVVSKTVSVVAGVAVGVSQVAPLVASPRPPQPVLIIGS